MPGWLWQGLAPPAAAAGVTGTFASTLGGVTLAASGTVTDVGTFAATLGAVTLAASGTVGSADVSGTFASTLADTTLAASGLVVVPGTFASTLGPTTLAASGSVVVAGTLATTLADATLAAAGAVTVTGTLAATLEPVALAAAGAVIQPVTGTFAATLDDVTLAAVGAVPVTSQTGAGRARSRRRWAVEWNGEYVEFWNQQEAYQWLIAQINAERARMRPTAKARPIARVEVVRKLGKPQVLFEGIDVTDWRVYGRRTVGNDFVRGINLSDIARIVERRVEADSHDGEDEDAALWVLFNG